MKSPLIVRDNTPEFYQQSPIRRVSKKHVCPICQKHDWCSVTEDGALAFCMRLSAGSIKRARNNAYIHVLSPTWSSRVPAVTAPPIGRCGSAETKRGDADHLNEVYSFLLGECLTLRPEHGDHLLNERGLGDTVIAAKLYASTPDKSELPSVCERMSSRFGDALLGVPGFYRNNRGSLWMPLCGGLFIPVRDVRGRIIGLQCRSDGNEQPKYKWFSTNPDNYHSGTSSGTPIHYSKPDLVERIGHAILVEGSLKGDIVSEYEEIATISVAGVSSFNGDSFGAEIRLAIPQLKETTIAFDADWKTNPQVRDGLFRLRSSLKAAGLIVRVRVWDGGFGKGIDDVLLNSERSR